MTDKNWIPLTNEDQLQLIREESKNQPVLIFKYSTRCSISATALNRLERNWNQAETPIKRYYLDLLAFRAISNKIAQSFDVEHQSPQVLVVKDAKPVLVQSHLGIDYSEIKKVVLTS
ncbi:thioredoxin family protein [Cytophagales bacterium WSM2-2]|nr:thioredoxin family protein [Cytophagales bacterium WSM2-2]